MRTLFQPKADQPMAENEFTLVILNSSTSLTLLPYNQSLTLV